MEAHSSCGESLLGRVGVERDIVLSTDQRDSGEVSLVRGGEVYGLFTSDGAIISLQGLVQRGTLTERSIALAAWSTTIPPRPHPRASHLPRYMLLGRRATDVAFRDVLHAPRRDASPASAAGLSRP